VTLPYLDLELGTAHHAFCNAVLTGLVVVVGECLESFSRGGTDLVGETTSGIPEKYIDVGQRDCGLAAIISTI
jgi:hypothetical protein